MHLFLIRHAAAVPRSAKLADADRPLTARGKKRWERAVRGLEALGVRFDRLYHSPWMRAVETAKPLHARVEGESLVAPELARRPTAALFDRLDAEKVALVGHQPWLGELAGMLLFGDPHAGPALELKKGSVAWLEGDARAGGMKLVALLPPKLLRAAARSE